MNNKQIAVEWSFEQNAFHREPLEQALTRAMRALKENRKDLYSIVAIADTEEKAQNVIEILKEQYTKDRKVVIPTA